MNLGSLPMVPTSRMDLSKYQSQMQVQLVELFAGANSCGDFSPQFGLLQEQSADTIENLLSIYIMHISF
jgi:hypothetical protein